MRSTAWVFLLLGAACAARPAASRPPHGTQPPTFVFVAGASQISTYRLMRETGTLIPLGSRPAGNRTAYGAVHPRGAVFLCDGTAPSQTHLLRLDWNTGDLVPAASLVVNPQRAVHCRLDPTGTFLLSSHFDGNTVSVTRLNGTSGFAGPPAITEACTSPHFVMTDHAARDVFVPCRDSAETFQFRWDPTRAALTPNPDTPSIRGPGLHQRFGGGPRHMDVHPGNRWVYILTEGGDLLLHAYDARRGSLDAGTPLQKIAGGAAHVEVTPDGRYLVASTRGGGGALHTFRIDDRTGALGPAHTFADPSIAGPRDFTIAPAGDFVIVGSTERRQLVVLALNATTGGLKKTDTAPTPTAPNWVGCLAKPARPQSVQ